jgi:hypothetical protein
MTQCSRHLLKGGTKGWRLSWVSVLPVGLVALSFSFFSGAPWINQCIVYTAEVKAEDAM